MLNIHHHTPPSFRQPQRENESTEKQRHGQKKTEQEDKRRAGEWKMRGDSGGICLTGILNFHSLSQTHKHEYTQRKRERAKEENDSRMLPTVDDAKMIIMPESPQ